MFKKVAEIMTPVEETLPLQASVLAAWSYFGKYRVGAAPLTDEQGKIKALCLLEKILAQPNFPAKAAALEFAEENPLRLSPEEPVESIWPLSQSWAAVINAKEKVIGLVSAQTVAQVYAFLADRKRKELDAAINCAHNGIIAIDQEGKITLFNPAAERLSRYPREQALGKYLTEVVIPSGLLEVLRTGQPQFGFRYQVGKRKYITNRTPIIQEGKVVGAIGVFQDISEIEVISEELSSVKRLNKELAAILDSTAEGILVCDQKGKILRFNQAFKKVMGEAKAEYIQEIFGREILRKVLTRKKPVSFVERGKESLNELLITFNPVTTEEGEVERVVVNVRDLTELNRLKEELEETKRISRRYHEELTTLRAQLEGAEEIVAHSTAMKKVLELAAKVAQVDSTVLIQGESGVGKEVVARFIHANSRRQGPFIKINCSAIPETLLESELFGYEAGAFTGASKHGKPGLFELADQGTLFLDEVGEIPLALQAKLLRALQEKEITRLGGVKPKEINVRILAATNTDLREKVKQKAFREDLYFRLNVVPIYIPPLRERKEDILPLIQKFQENLWKRYHLKKEFTPEALKKFLQYPWPGNVRELENVIEFLYVTVNSTVIKSEDLPVQFREEFAEKSVVVNKVIPLKKAVQELERQLIQQALAQYGSTYKAAAVLKVNQSTIARKLKKIKGQAKG